MTTLENKRLYHIVSELQEAQSLLKIKDLHVPDLLSYLQKLQNHNVTDLEELIRFTRLSPFFQEGDDLIKLRSLYKGILDKLEKDWSEFITDRARKLVDDLASSNEVDIIEQISKQIFAQILKPILGLTPREHEEFDADTIDLQALVQPHRSIKELKQINAKIKRAIRAIETSLESANKSANNTALAYILNECDWPQSKTDKISVIIILYAATAPLAQTAANIIANRLSGKSIQIGKLKTSEVAFAAAQRYLHRRSSCHKQLNSKPVENYLFDIQAIQRNGYPAFPFGHGRHFCLGFTISNTILTAIVNRFFQNFPNAKLIYKEYNLNNKIAYQTSSLIIRTK